LSRWARHKDNLGALTPATLTIKQGPSFGAVHLVHEVARALEIDTALGNSREGQLALWQVIARVIDQGSRLSSVRKASRIASISAAEQELKFAMVRCLTLPLSR
jgi:hypothetical protein